MCCVFIPWGSAIFTAIQLGLGGKAQDTWRDRSIKPFVKKGRPSARICITLGNDGEGAYQPEVYGNSIRIVRTITSSGGSSYEIIAENGAKIGDKRRNVASVTSHFNIQLSNIGCMMSQNAAAQFLRKSGPEKSYEMVVRGLQLDEMEESLKRTKEFVQDLKQQHEDMKRRRKDLEKEKKDSEELVQRS
jgi:structural maintenance of chromosomes protein 6